MAYIHASLTQWRHCLLCQVVLADTAYQDGIQSQPPGEEGHVCSLATRQPDEITPHQRQPTFKWLIEPDLKVRVDTSQGKNCRTAQVGMKHDDSIKS